MSTDVDDEGAPEQPDSSASRAAVAEAVAAAQLAVGRAQDEVAEAMAAAQRAVSGASAGSGWSR